MYKKLITRKSFEKEARKLRISNTHQAKIYIYIGKLLSNEPLPNETRDHPLTGEYMDYRECHLGGDLLIIYRITDNTVALLRIGSHAQLFK
ncbi:MAG: type II toxin-antitoxin system YafQ family toxin [Gammaproteobacteria bacterium]|uniref:YafQ toxin protein n=1 Tax=hydrothermal vent metagenome TaxID=652676 RepID=A0A1W1E5N2_9ZZZZ|nr:type II toxin-antitoxin system YafQ family toxin [Gammaproteobacteria bacterium]